MSVTLTPDVEQKIRHWIETGRYPDADAVIEKALQALEAEEQARFLKARELILAGLNSGNTRELTPELMDEIERRAEERSQRGEKPSPHVCP
jgi:putative addiction module CopG family antidote